MPAMGASRKYFWLLVMCDQSLSGRSKSWLRSHKPQDGSISASMIWRECVTTFGLGAGLHSHRRGHGFEPRIAHSQGPATAGPSSISVLRVRAYLRSCSGVAGVRVATDAAAGTTM